MNIEFNTKGDVLQMELSFGLSKAGADQHYATKAELATETASRQTADNNEVSARNAAITAETAARTAAITAEATARAAADTAEVTARNNAIAAQAAIDAATYETKLHAAATYLKNAFVQIIDANGEYIASEDDTKIIFLGFNGVKVEIDNKNATVVFDGGELKDAINTKLSSSAAAATYATITSLAAYMTAGYAKMKVGSSTATAATKTAEMTFADAGGIMLSLNTSTNTLTIDGSEIKAIAQAAIPSPAIEGSNGDVLTTDGNGGRQWRTPIGDMVRYSSQTLSQAQKTQARNNIDAASKESVNDLSTSIGDLSQLSTTDKSKIVAAINEVDGVLRNFGESISNALQAEMRRAQGTEQEIDDKVDLNDEITAAVLANLNCRISAIEASIRSGFAKLTVDNLFVKAGMKAYMFNGEDDDDALVVVRAYAPNFIPKCYAQRWFDTVAKKWYKPTGLTSISNWVVDN